MRGLEGAVGSKTAAQVAKGCRVHFTRSVKRVSERANKSNPLAHKVFTTIAYHIPDVSTEEDVLKLFDVLTGEKPLLEVLAICQLGSTTVQYADVHKPENWKPLKHWAEWWKRPSHLREFITIQHALAPFMQMTSLHRHNVCVYTLCVYAQLQHKYYFGLFRNAVWMLFNKRHF